VPTYQYACTECGSPLEVVQRFSDPALTECPTCGGRLRKVFSAVGVVFKGSGFYRTDSRDSSSAKSNGEAKPVKDPAASPSKDAAPSGSKSTDGTAGANGSSSGTSASSNAAKSSSATPA
jgi:putative FmdB family regulatory protein